jgi:hypothetical protein
MGANSMMQFIKWLFASKQERHNQQLQATNDADTLADKVRLIQIKVDQLSHNDLSRFFEVVGLLEELQRLAIAQKRSIMIKCQAKTIAVNYSSGKAWVNYFNS